METKNFNKVNHAIFLIRVPCFIDKDYNVGSN